MKTNVEFSDESKFVRECEMRLAKSTPGPMDLHRIDNQDGTIAYQIQQAKDAPTTLNDIGGIVVTQFDDADNPNAKNDATFHQHAGEMVRRLCQIVHMMDRRNSQSNVEPADTVKPYREVIGYRIRWYSDLTKSTRWYAEPITAARARDGKLFLTKQLAKDRRTMLNDGWQTEAKIVRVVRATNPKDKP